RAGDDAGLSHHCPSLLCVEGDETPFHGNRSPVTTHYVGAHSRCQQPAPEFFRLGVVAGRPRSGISARRHTLAERPVTPCSARARADGAPLATPGGDWYCVPPQCGEPVTRAFPAALRRRFHEPRARRTVEIGRAHV